MIAVAKNSPLIPKKFPPAVSWIAWAHLLYKRLKSLWYVFGMVI